MRFDIRKFDTRKLIKWPTLIIGYVFCQFISNEITSVVLGTLAETQSNTAPAVDWPNLILIIIAESMALIFITQHSRLSGFRLLAVLTLVYAGTKVFMMQIEAAFFLNIWPSEPLLSLHSVMFFTVQGVIGALLFCSIVIGLCSKWKTPSGTISAGNVRIGIIPLLKIAIIYVPIYFLAGLFLAMPLGGEAFKETYATLTVPTWLPLFQLGRGFLWALILWALLDMTDEHYLRPVAAAAMAVFGAVQLLYPNPYMAEQLRAAHLIEVSVSMAIFGWLAAGIYARSLQTIEPQGATTKLSISR